MSDAALPATPEVAAPAFSTPGIPTPTHQEQVQARIAHYASAGVQLNPSEAAYQLQMEKSIDAQRATPNAPAVERFQEANTLDERFKALHEANMQPARSASEYNLPQAPDMPQTPETEAEGLAVRSAMIDVGLPGWLGSSIGQSLYDDAPALATMTPAQLGDHRERTYSQLEAMWGGEAKGRIDRLQAFMQQAAGKHPALREVARLMDLSPTALDALSQFVEHRHRQGSR